MSGAARVCHVLRPAEGGMLTQVRLLLAGEEGTLLAAPPAVLAALSGVVQAAPFPLSPSGSPRAQWRDGLALGRWVGGKADLLHGHGLARAPLFAIAARAARLPFVITLHNLVGSLSPPERLLARLALRRARKIICVSDAVKASAAALGVQKNCEVVRNGIELAPFLSVVPQRSARTVLCVARLSKEKGVDVLIEALARLDAPGVRLLIAGDGPERAALLQKAGEGTTLLGHRTDIARLLSTAEVFCAPSRTEGLGLAAIEAMAAGLPVIASRVGGLCEVVEDGQTGLLVPPEDPEALAAALAALLDDPARRREMGRAGQERAKALFDAEVMRKKTRALYAEVLG